MNSQEAQLIAELAEALDALLAEQNGPPLIKHEEKWEKAYNEGYRALCHAEQMIGRDKQTGKFGIKQRKEEVQRG